MQGIGGNFKMTLFVHLISIFLLVLTQSLLEESVVFVGAASTEIPCSTRDGDYEKIYTVPENSGNGTRIGQLDIVGEATGEKPSIKLETRFATRMCGQVLCSSLITFNPESQHFALSLRDDQVLDRDENDSVEEIEIIIFCKTLRSVDQVNITILVHIKISDENDNDPTFVNEPYHVQMNELTDVGSSVFTVTATDLDTLSVLSYNIIDNLIAGLPAAATTYFEIPNSLTGTIILKKQLDYEDLVKTSSSRIRLQVEVIDRGGMSKVERIVVTTVEIEITDGDDQPPIFSSCARAAGVCLHSIYQGFVQEQTASAFPIELKPSSLQAVDADLAINEEIVYSLAGGDRDGYSEYFQVNPSSGHITAIQDIPTAADRVDFTLYVKACQRNNTRMFSVAEVQLKVVAVLEDRHAPVISFPFPAQSYRIDLTEDVSFLRSNDDYRLLRLVAHDQDDPSQKLDFSCDSQYFEITTDGFVVARNSEIASRGMTNFALQIRASNPQATNSSKQQSEAVVVSVQLRETSTSDPTSCCDLLTGTNMDFTAPFVVFLILFIICLVIIAYLVVKLRRYKEMAEASANPPYVVNEQFSQRRLEQGHTNAGFKAEARSAKPSRYGHVPTPPVDDDIPHIAPLGTHAVKKKKIISDEDSTSIAPYRSSSSLAHDWNTDDVVHTLSLKQIRVENWLSETDEKKCGVGEVNLGSPNPCFVKILKGEYGDKLSVSDDVVAMSHVLHYKSCDHPNLVKFYGSCLVKDSLYLVSEFVSSRDLSNVLISSRTLEHSAVISTLSGMQLMNFSIGVAEALVYLHGNDVVHGALCARNVLINDKLTPKLYECCGENSQRLRIHSNRWTAPEVSVTHPYSEKADVWAFGILMWEILSLGGTPFEDLNQEKVPSFVRRQLSTGGTILPVTRNTTKRLWLLLQSCWVAEPADRFGIAEISMKLKRMKDASNAITVAKAPGYCFFPYSST